MLQWKTINGYNLLALIYFMPFRTFAFISLLSALFFTAVKAANSQVSPKPKTKPNVVFIVVDDMNTLGVKKNYPQLKIPATTKLMEESYYFSNGTCAAPVCNPSRTAFFSGISPHNTGSYFNGVNPWLESQSLAATEVMPETFQKNGYTTWAGGKIFHVLPNDGREKKMFDNEIFKGNYGPFSDREDNFGKGRWNVIHPWTGPDTDFTDVVNADRLVEFLSQSHNKPFFAYFGLYRPHSPYTAPKKFYDLYKGVNFTPPPGFESNDLEDVPTWGKQLAGNMNFMQREGMSKREVWMEYMRAYCANTSFADWNVGRVLEALDKSAYADNTIVIFISDNGFHTGVKNHWQKGTLWNASSNIPFLIRLPGKKKMVLPQTVNTIDIYPTLIEFCGLQPPEHTLDGKSMVPLFRNPSSSWGRNGLTFYGEGFTGVLSQRYRYIRYPDGTDELYDHKSDPYELKNISNEPSMAAVKKEMNRSVPSIFAKSLGGKSVGQPEE